MCSKYMKIAQKRVKKHPLPPIETPKTSFFTLFQLSQNHQNTKIHENALKFDSFFARKNVYTKNLTFFQWFFSDFSVIFQWFFHAFLCCFLWTFWYFYKKVTNFVLTAKTSKNTPFSKTPKSAKNPHFRPK